MTGMTDNPSADTEFQVAAFYKFVPLDDIESLQTEIHQMCMDAGLLGTILLAAEGINGTVAGTGEGISTLFNQLRKYPAFTDLGNKISYCNRNPFYRMKVRLKKEIVTLGVEGIDPRQEVGE